MTDDYRPRRAERNRRGPGRVIAWVAGLLALLLAVGSAGYLLSQPGKVPAVAPAATTSAGSPTSATPATAATEPTESTESTAAVSADAELRESVRVTSVPNFRDVAGDGIELTDGARMATGLVYRSAKLSTLSTADRAELADAGVSDIFDLRTPDVARRSPDGKIQGATNHLVNLYALDRAPTPPRTNVAAAKDYMRKLYRGFVTDAEQRERIASVLTEIGAAGDPVIVHCSEGKDRTGWVSALLQFVAGADEETVRAEYLRSNEERAEEIERSYAATRKASGSTAADIDRALKSVEDSYLDAALDEVAKRYGSVPDYLSAGLGLKPETLTELRAKLRVETR